MNAQNSRYNEEQSHQESARLEALYGGLRSLFYSPRSMELVYKLVETLVERNYHLQGDNEMGQTFHPVIEQSLDTLSARANSSDSPEREQLRRVKCDGALFALAAAILLIHPERIQLDPMYYAQFGVNDASTNS